MIVEDNMPTYSFDITANKKHKYKWANPNYAPFNENDYIVNTNGTIYSKRRNTFLSYSLNKNGYFYCYYLGKYRAVHRIIAEKYIPNPNNYKYINHKNKIRTDNRVENLEWCDSKYNVRYSKAKKIYCYDKTYKLKAVKNCTKDFVDIGFKHAADCAAGFIKTCKGLIFSYIPLTEEEVKNRYSKSFRKAKYYNEK